MSAVIYYIFGTGVGTLDVVFDLEQLKEENQSTQKVWNVSVLPRSHFKVMFDEKLTFNNHIKYIFSKAYSMLGFEEFMDP